VGLVERHSCLASREGSYPEPLNPAVCCCSFLLQVRSRRWAECMAAGRISLLKAPGGVLTIGEDKVPCDFKPSWEDDNSVLVGDHGSARTDPHSADLDRLVNLAGAGLAALAWVCTQRLDANV
jgi:hypothetical protein